MDPAEDEDDVRGGGAGYFAGGGFCTAQLCEGCGSLSFSQEWLDAFGVALCGTCKREESLITKSNAKERYLLGDKDLAKLGCITKTNPLKKSWTGMKLYMESQVREVAARKHGGLGAVAEERQRKLQARLDDRLRKRTADMEAAVAEAMAGEGDGDAAGPPRSKAPTAQDRVRQRLREEYEAHAGPSGSTGGGAAGPTSASPGAEPVAAVPDAETEEI